MKKIILITLFLSSFIALGEEAYISEVQFSGSGCTEDEAVAVLSPDQHVLSLLFDNFVVEAGGEAARRNRKNCQIKLSIATPENKRLVIEKIDYRGYAFVTESGRMNFSSQYYFFIPTLGISSRNFKDVISKNGETDDEILVEQNIKDRILKRACGEDVELNIRTDLSVMVRHPEDEIYASIDSLDSGIDYHISYEDCNQRRVRTPRERDQREIARRRARNTNRRNLQRQASRRENRLRQPRRVRRGNESGRVTRPDRPSQMNRNNESSDAPNVRQRRNQRGRVVRPERPRQGRRRYRP